VHRWWVFLHVAGVFGFLMAHGVSAYVSMRLPRERDPARVSSLLELSASSTGVMWNSIGVLLVGGVAAGFTGHFWGQGWIWAAIVVLIAVMAAMFAMGTRWAARLRTISAAMAEGTEAVSQQQFEELLRSRQPYALAGVGFAGLALILWLMLFKPTLGFGGPQECAPSADADVTVCAFDDQAFVPERLSAPAGQAFTMSFDNEDSGVQHNVAIYPDDTAEDAVFAGDLVAGPDTVRYDVAALDPGSYFFRCDVHPATMTGTIEVA
jgi:plastocyanin